MSDSPVKIIAEPGLDPHVCKFTVDRPLYLGGSVNCASADEARGSALLESLFGVEGVAQVNVAGSVVTVAKSGAREWPAIGKEIGAAIRAAIDSKRELISAELVEKASAATKSSTAHGLPAADLTSPVAQAIKKVLDERINPAVASHGGHVRLVDVRGTDAYIEMSGGCQGCGSADATLKQGISVAIKQAVPTIQNVYDITDHAEGQNPYYRPGEHRH